MGFLSRKPKPGSEVCMTFPDGKVKYGIYMGHARVGIDGRPPGDQIATIDGYWAWEWVSNLPGGKVAACEDGSMPRIEFRAVMRAEGAGGMSAEEMALGPGATDEELDACWAAIQYVDAAAIERMRLQVAARRAGT